MTKPKIPPASGISRLPGHALWSEGWPVTATPGQGAGWYPLAHQTGVGRALCECGEMSSVLGSANERKRWHRNVHKPAVAAAFTEAAEAIDRLAIVDETPAPAAGEKP